MEFIVLSILAGIMLVLGGLIYVAICIKKAYIKPKKDYRRTESKGKVSNSDTGTARIMDTSTDELVIGEEMIYSASDSNSSSKCVDNYYSDTCSNSGSSSSSSSYGGSSSGSSSDSSSSSFD